MQDEDGQSIRGSASVTGRSPTEAAVRGHISTDRTFKTTLAGTILPSIKQELYNTFRGDN